MAEITTTAKAVRNARSELESVRSKAADISRKIARLERQGAKQGQDHRNALEQIQADYAKALLAGEEPPHPDQGILEKLRAGDHLAAAAATARTSLQGELASLQVEEADSLERLSGAVFTWTTELQDDARREVVQQLATLAPALARLLAIDEVRRRYVGERLKLSGFTGARPWSSAVVVRKLIDSVPSQFASPAVSFEQLADPAKNITDAIVAQIEGE